MVQMAVASSSRAGRISIVSIGAPPLRDDSGAPSIREINCDDPDDEQYFGSLMDLNLTHVRTLQAVVDHRSFSRAADSLHLSQPAVSLHIRQLEEGAGHRLLERVGKRAFPTKAIAAPGRGLKRAPITAAD